jgi:hypothetical protein
MSNIMTQLPNDVIMKIIQMADGGRATHKIRLKRVLNSIEGVGEEYSVHKIDKIKNKRTGVWVTYLNDIEQDQFFCGLYHRGDLTNTVSDYRRNRPTSY